MTTTGWCIADGKYWTWVGEAGTITRQVPNLNDQSPYLAGTPSNGRTITDRVIAASGQIAGHALTIAEIPSHKHAIRLNHEQGGVHDEAGFPTVDFSGLFTHIVNHNLICHIVVVVAVVTHLVQWVVISRIRMASVICNQTIVILFGCII